METNIRDTPLSSTAVPETAPRLTRLPAPTAGETIAAEGGVVSKPCAPPLEVNTVLRQGGVWTKDSAASAASAVIV